LNDIYKLLPAFTSLCQMLKPEIHGSAICDLIRKQSKYAITGLRSMVQAVSIDHVSENRLSKTGILWESCLELQKAESLVHVMSQRNKECLQMLEDAVEDLESWLAGDLDDNFGDFEDSGSDSEGSVNPQIRETDKQTDLETERRIMMLKRTQLLLKAIGKRKITRESPVSLLNALYDNISKLSVEVDDLAGEIQEHADPAYIMEMEKVVVHRVEQILTASSLGGKDDKWQEWITNFKKRWLEDINPAGK